ncbi:MAG: hypothetical protein JXB50_12345 [Spirochaetes bacterium]|nr:hypothetical protein [Spirochaetota bacterium]
MRKYIILLALILILTMFSCNGIINELIGNTRKNQANIEIAITDENSDKINKLIDLLNFRFDKYGITAKFDKTNLLNNKLYINVRNFKNINELESLLINQGIFKITIAKNPGDGDDIFASSITERFVKNVMPLENRGKYFINFELFDYYKEQFSDFSQENIGKNVKFILDDKVIFMPLIRERINNGQIKLYFPDTPFNQLLFYEVILLSGPLPVKLSKENVKININVS